MRRWSCSVGVHRTCFAVAERSEHSPDASWNRQSGRVVQVCFLCQWSGRLPLNRKAFWLECLEELISRSTVTCVVSQLRGVESPLKGEGADFLCVRGFGSPGR